MIGLIIAAVKVAGIVLGAKTAVEGIKEGNIAKAVLGGIGAFTAMSSLSGTASNVASQTAADTAVKGIDFGTGIDAMNADKLAAASFENPLGPMADTPSLTASAPTSYNGLLTAPQGLTDNALNLAQDINNTTSTGASNGLLNQSVNFVKDGLNRTGDTVVDALSETSDNINKLFETDVNLDPTDIREGNTQNGLLGDFGGFLNNNQLLAGTGLQLLGGYQQREFLKEQMEENERKERERRERMGTAPSYVYGFGGPSRTV